MQDYPSNQLFLKLDRPALERAAARLQPARPFVRRIGGRRYQVTGRRGARYVVDLTSARGLELGNCSCPAKQVCRHQAAAVIFEKGVGR